MRRALPILAVLLAALVAACEPPPTQPLLGSSILETGAILAFAPGRATLETDESVQLVRMMPQLRAALAELPPGDRRLCIAGHTDNTGSEPVNRDLSRLRAESVAERLIDFGIPINEIVMRGYGSSRPFIAGRPNVAEPSNRIVVISNARNCTG